MKVFPKLAGNLSHLATLLLGRTFWDGRGSLSQNIVDLGRSKSVCDYPVAKNVSNILRAQLGVGLASMSTPPSRGCAIHAPKFMTCGNMPTVELWHSELRRRKQIPIKSNTKTTVIEIFD